MSAIALDMHGVELHFGGVVVLRGVDFRIEQGETVGIVGPNGAGKTSLLNCISRIYRPDAGTIAIYDRNVDELRADQVAELGVARTFQAVDVFRDMSVLDVVLLGRHVRLRENRWACALGLPAWRRTEAEHRLAARSALEFVGLDAASDARIGDLPYGAIKRVDLARALAVEPRLLLLDEPAAGLDRSGRHGMTELLSRIRNELGITQAIIEHDMGLVNAVCDRLLVLDAGRAIATGPPAQVMADPVVRSAFLGGLDAGS